MTREEAIERIKSRYDKWALDDKDLEAIRCTFPELAESEDERINNELYEQLAHIFPDKTEFDENGNVLPIYYERIERYRAYLEKQKDLAAIPDELVKNYRLFCANGRREVAVLINAINGINEQKPEFYPGDVIKCTSSGSLWVRCKDGDNIKSDGHTACIGGGYELASEEEAEQFFQELDENGYQWDFIKGRPKKKEQKPAEKSVIQEKENEVMKAIEGVIRVYEKTQGEWIAGYDMDTLVVHLRKAFAALEKQKEPTDKGEISDGYHTFNELYYYRMLYNAAFFNLLPKEWVHKSKKHHDGEECFGGGWFIVMANLPTGQISNHYELKDWELFQIPEKEVADEWDGHTPQEAADRLHKYLLEKPKEQKPGEDNEYRKAYLDGWNARNLQAAREQQSAGWSEEDEKRVKQLIYDTEHIRAQYEERKKELGKSFNDELIKDCDEQIAWLKSLSLNLKKKNEDVAKLCSTEWSEEDKKMIEDIVYCLPKMAMGNIEMLPSVAESYAERLKSLRPSWKPSEEQMVALDGCIEHWQGNTYQKEILESLYEQLKKLM